MKYALYCRVSTAEQTTENQKIKLIEYAERMGWDYDLYEEQESSRKTRPIKAKLLDRLRKKEYAGVAVWKLSRWARSVRETALEVEELHSKGVHFISLSENIDFSTSMGKFQLHIFSAFAQLERDIIRENTLLGLQRAKMQGKKLGRPKGSKDKKRRRKSGYFMRFAGKK